MKEKILYRMLSFLIVFTALFIITCSLPSPIVEEEIPISYTFLELTTDCDVAGDQVFSINTSGYVDLSYDLTLTTAPADVYFIFTNTSTASSVNKPVVTSSIVSKNNNLSVNKRVYRPSVDLIGLRGKPAITAFNNSPFVYTEDNLGGAANKNLIAPSGPSFATVDDPLTFKIDESDTVAATCRKTLTVGGKTVNIWVANDCWSGAGVKTYEVTTAMTDVLAEKFLKSGVDNDIYDWLSNIYGAEWGAHSFSELIGDTDEIDILLFDIDGDDVPAGGVVMGYFWAKDNFKSSGAKSIAYSNERVMFYLDAVMYARPDGGTWEDTDTWPSEMFSTLGHEFQHMIHFYQKAVLRTGSSNSETWINEMCSLVSEDLIARKLQVSGPRGVAWDDGTAGSSGNSSDRLSRYNTNNDDAVAAWSGTLENYSVNYAFGAFLARNFGGAQLFKDIIQNTSTNYEAINNALTAGSYSKNFADVLQAWGVANILSDNTNPTSDCYQYNNTGWFNSTIGSISYDLGSINLYNYSPTPTIYTTLPTSGGMNGSSNIYYNAGVNLSGSNRWRIKIDSGVRLTVIVRG